MNLSINGLRPKSFEVQYAAEADKSSAVIHLYLVATESTAILEIGQSYVLRKSPITFFKRRRIRGLSLSIERRSEDVMKQLEQIGMSDGHIGRLTFMPRTKKEKEISACPACIMGRIVISEDLHEDLRSMLQRRVTPTRLSVEIEEGGLDYGWEPDGSRMIWKIENETKSSSLDIAAIEINIRNGVFI